MQSWAYTGRSSGGDLVRGVLEGATATAVADVLLGRGITPLEISAAEAKGGAGAGEWLGRLTREKVQHLDVMLFSRQLHTLLKAGVPIMRALAGIQESSQSKAMVGVLRDVRESLDSGRELSNALSRHPKVFSPFYLSMVRVGEMTGLLDAVFLRLFHHLDFEKFMRDQVKSALRYPVIVMIAMAIAMLVINIFVIPQFAKVYKGFNVALPLPTQLLMGFSDFMVAWWPALLGLLLGGMYVFRLYIGTAAGRFAWDRFKLRIPIIGKIVLKATLARFSRSLAMALKSGVPVVQALTVTAQTVDNDYVASRIEKMREGVER
ncbi:MAG: MSHA biogenesis protein MshG, partial [Rhodocyclaceae bacterium]|nr:MSHA biogenesis protein MshG [Rhodocyclaceae bacterium]